MTLGFRPLLDTGEWAVDAEGAFTYTLTRL